MSITVTPSVELAGTAVAITAGGPDLVAVDALSVVWGRSSVLEEAQPATASLTVLDRSEGSTFARRRDLIGQPLLIEYVDDASASRAGTVFRGRVTDVAVRPRPGAAAGAGLFVDLAASSLEVDLANVVMPAGRILPPTTFASRAFDLEGYMPAGLFPGGVQLPDGTDVGLLDPAALDPRSLGAAQADVSGRNLLDLLRELYASTSPLPMVYDPGAQKITFAPRRRNKYDPARGLTLSAGLFTSPDHGGRYVAAALGGRHLDGHRLAYPRSGSLSQGIDSRVTRVEVQWLDETAAYDERTHVLATEDGPLEATIGRRTLAVTTIHAQPAGAAQLAGFYADLIDREARTPRLAPVTFSTAREPFPDLATAGLLLKGMEQAGQVFLGRTWLPQAGQSPLVGVLGGTITYAAGEWLVDFTPAPTVVDPRPYSWAPLTIRASAVPGVTLKQIDPSVTFGDFAYLDLAAGRTSSGAVPYQGNPT